VQPASRDLVCSGAAPGPKRPAEAGLHAREPRGRGAEDIVKIKRTTGEVCYIEEWALSPLDE